MNKFAANSMTFVAFITMPASVVQAQFPGPSTSEQPYALPLVPDVKTVSVPPPPERAAEATNPNPPLQGDFAVSVAPVFWDKNSRKPHDRPLRRRICRSRSDNPSPGLIYCQRARKLLEQYS